MAGFLPPVVFLIEAKADQFFATSRKVNAELTAMEAKALKAGKSVSAFSKAAVIGTAVLKGFTLAFIGLAAIGVKSLMDIEKSYNRLSQAMGNMGLATKQNLADVSKLVDSYEGLGFGSEKAADAMSVLVTATGDLTKSQHLLAVAADLARAKNMSMEEAAQALVRAQGGAAKLFTQFGIKLDETKPKAEATAEAMAKLEARLKGQADAYAKTTAGQLAILKESFGDLAEAVGGPVLRAFNGFISVVRKTGSFLANHIEILIGLAAVLVAVMIPAIVKLTQKLYAQAVAWAAANWEITLIVAAIAALVAGFVWAWNKFEWFRKGVATGLQQLVKGFGYLVKAIGFVGENIIKYFLTPFRVLLEALSHLPKVGKYAQTALDFIDKGISSIGNVADAAGKKIVDFGQDLYGLSKNKIDINFGIPQLKDLGNTGGGALDKITEAAQEVADALEKARERARDFRDEMVKGATEIALEYKKMVNFDLKDSIRFGLLDPVDQLIESVPKLQAAYAEAGRGFGAASSQLTAAQKAYETAIRSNNKAAIAAAERALKQAEDSMSSALDKVKEGQAALTQLQADIAAKIVDLYKEIAALQEERAKVIKEGQKQEEEATKAHLIKLRDLQKNYEKQVSDARKEAAKRSAEIVQQSVDQLRGIYRTATQKSIGDIFSALTFEGRYAKGGTIEKLLGALGLQTTKAKTLADDAAKLSGLGFSQTFIEQVVAQGPDIGHELAQTILKATPESQSKLQEYWTALDQQSQHGVDAIAKQLNSGITLATEELTASLAQVQKDLQDQLAGFTKDFTDATADAVAEYKDKLLEIQAATAAAVANIDALISKKQGQIASLESAAGSIATTPFPSAVIPFVPSGIIPDVVPVPVVPVTPEPTTEPTPVTPWGGYTPTTPTATKPTTTKYVVKPGDTLTKIAKEQGTTLAKILADNPKFTEVDKYKGGNMIWSGTTVNITANTNATSQSIASDVGWAIRTSSDVQYGSGVNTTTLAGIQSASSSSSTTSSSPSAAKIRMLERMAE